MYFKLNVLNALYAIVHVGLSCRVLGVRTFSLPQLSPSDFARTLRCDHGQTTCPISVENLVFTVIDIPLVRNNQLLYS